MSNTLLIVDDAEFMRYILRDLFAGAGLETVAEAGTRGEALDLARSLRPDIVVVDTTTESDDGLLLIREVSALLPEARIIAAVQAGAFDAAVAAGKAGADYTIVKPYDPTDVMILMRTLEAQPQMA